jgi:hypothetical protein
MVDLFISEIYIEVYLYNFKHIKQWDPWRGDMKVSNGALVAVLAAYLIVSPGTVSAALVTIGWNDNTDPDLAGYKVYCGAATGEYDYILNVGLNNQVYVHGLEEDTTYYFAITAYDESGNESSFSREVQTTIPNERFPLLDIILDFGLSILDVLYEFSTYIPASSMILEDSILGIHVEIPSGATSSSLPIAIGTGGQDLNPFSSQMDQAAQTIEFDIAPNGLILLKPALISVPFDQDRVGVKQYDERSRSWVQVEDVQVSDGVVSFSTLTLGRFKVYPLPEAEDNGDYSGSPGSGEDGGGGCFISTCASEHAVPPGLTLIILLANIALIGTSYSCRKRMN